MDLWWFVPNRFRSNDWLIDDVLDALTDQELKIGERANRIDHEARRLKAEIKKELIVIGKELTSVKNSSQFEKVIKRSSTLETIEKIRVAYSETLRMLAERKLQIELFRSNLIISDVQLEIDKTMDYITSSLTIPKLQEKLQKGKVARGKMQDTMLLVEQSIESTPLTEEEQKEHARACSARVAGIAKLMKRDDIVTQINRLDFNTGQFTSASEVDAAFSTVS